jgi:hypothetical protein
VDRFVARLNVEHLKQQLADETDETKRQVLNDLLAEEATKLAKAEAEHRNKGG